MEWFELKLSRTVAALSAAVCAAFVAAQAACAAGFGVNPIHLELNPSHNATSLTVTNYNSNALFMQARVYRWEHQGGEDVLTEAAGDAPIVTPPLFRLAPGGGSQLIRIGFDGTSAPPAAERRWRVVVEEVPTAARGPAELAGDAAPPLSIAVHVRVSLPLFQRPAAVHQELQWSLDNAASGAVILSAQNLGSVSERVDELHLGVSSDAGAGLSGPIYMFPGERRTFDLHPAVALPPGKVRLSVQGTPRPLIHELVLSAQ